MPKATQAGVAWEIWWEIKLLTSSFAPRCPTQQAIVPAFCILKAWVSFVFSGAMAGRGLWNSKQHCGLSLDFFGHVLIFSPSFLCYATINKPCPVSSQETFCSLKPLLILRCKGDGGRVFQITVFYYILWLLVCRSSALHF